jgi:hypothetical protein
MSQKFDNNGGCVFSNNNGNLQMTVATGGSSYGAFMGNTYIKNKIIKMKLNVTNCPQNVTVQNGLGNNVIVIRSVGTYEITFVGTSSTANFNNLYIMSAYAFELIVEQIYIGDGNYSTPIIDNANGQFNATNNGGIAVQGVSGKGVVGFKSHSIGNINGFNLSNNFSLSVWINPANNTENLDGDIFFKANQFVLRNGFNDRTNRVVAVIYNPDTSSYVAKTLLNNLLPANKWQHLVVIRNGLSLLFYIDGVLKSTNTLTFNTTNKNDNIAVVHRGTAYARETSYDDLLIFDRALSEAEVLALYLNKANTPKYYTKADLQLPQKQDSTLSSPITIGGQTYTTVESALQALAGAV